MVNSKFDLLFMNFGTYRSERYYLFFSLTSSAVSYFFGQMNEKFKDINLIDMTQRSVDHCAHKRHTDGGANFLKKKRLLLRINHQSQKQKKNWDTARSRIQGQKVSKYSNDQTNRV